MARLWRPACRDITEFPAIHNYMKTSQCLVVIVPIDGGGRCCRSPVFMYLYAGHHAPVTRQVSGCLQHRVTLVQATIYRKGHPNSCTRQCHSELPMGGLPPHPARPSPWGRGSAAAVAAADPSVAPLPGPPVPPASSGRTGCSSRKREPGDMAS